MSGKVSPNLQKKKEYGMNICGENIEVTNGLLNVTIAEETIKRKIKINY
jgi:hypothetical protein